MESFKQSRTLCTSGIVCIDSWNSKGDISGLSLITANGSEYRVKSGNIAKSLARHVWDDVDIEFNFVGSLNGIPFVDVLGFNVKATSDPIEDDLEYGSFEEETDKWKFDVTNFIDQFDDSDAA